LAAIGTLKFGFKACYVSATWWSTGNHLGQFAMAVCWKHLHHSVANSVDSNKVLC